MVKKLDAIKIYEIAEFGYTGNTQDDSELTRYFPGMAPFFIFKTF